MTNHHALTHSDICARAQQYVAQNDTQALKELVDLARNDVCYKETRKELIDIVLSTDQMDMAQACFDAATVLEWCITQNEHMILHCPNLFIRWTRFTSDATEMIGKVLESLPGDERLGILTGKSKRVPGTFLYQSLVNNPADWEKLTPAWLGTPQSPTRDAAIALGWQPIMLPAMVEKVLRVPTIEHWLDALTYPYSLALAAVEDERATSQKERERKRAKGMLTGKPINYPKVTLECDPRANPVDIEMALALVAKTQLHNVVELRTNAPRVSFEEQVHINSIVDMHLSLDSLGMLVELLCNDKLVGVPPSHGVELGPEALAVAFEP